MLFIDNKYTQIYKRIVTQARLYNTSDTYTEMHHIIPKSLGGSDCAENLVRLTAREHFICHWLLTKMTINENRYRMLYAFQMMIFVSGKTQERYVNARAYQTLKEEISIARSHRQKGKRHSQETKDKISLSNTGKKRTVEQLERIRGKYKGSKSPLYKKKKSLEHTKKIQKAKEGKNNPNWEGYYVTPWGTFDSLKKAIFEAPIPNSLERATLRRWCRNNNKVITKFAIVKSTYLTEDSEGFSFAELGFDYIPS